jgi:magnesium-protoporphyrin IX monomethyl ester (oxidative) cyclase
MLHNAMGLDSDEYDYTVFRITTEISKQVFPISLDTDHPTFRAGLKRLFELQTRIDQAKARGGLMGKLTQGWCTAAAVLTFGRLYCLPVQRHDLPVNVRVAPAW